MRVSAGPLQPFYNPSMHEALITVARMIALAHDHWRATIGQRRPLYGNVAILEEQLQRLRAEKTLLQRRMQRVPAKRRPHYRREERLEILWHAARYSMSIADTAAAFGVTRQTITNWRRDLRRDAPRGLHRIGTLGELVTELVIRLKAEWPAWGTRRIAGQLARLGVKVSRSSVQRIVRRGPRDPVEPEQAVTASASRTLLAKRPNHVWMIDFTRIGGIFRPLWVGAVIDAYSRRVLAIGAMRGAPTGAFAVLLLRRAIRSNGSPRWLVSDQDPVLRGGLVQRLLTRRGILRRYGAVGKSGSIALIERFWRSLKQEYVRHLFLYRPMSTMQCRLERYRIWFNQERPHQGHGQRTPDDVYLARPEKPTRDVAGGRLYVRFHDGDPRLPVLRLRDAA